MLAPSPLLVHPGKSTPSRDPFWSPAPEALSFPSLAHSWSLLSPHWWVSVGAGLELEGRPTVSQALCWDQIYDTSLSLHNDSLRQGSVSHFGGEEREARLALSGSCKKELNRDLSPICLRPPAEMSLFPSAAS